MMPSLLDNVAASEPLQVELGPAWNLEHDVLVLAGAGGTPTIDDLLGRGVRRLVVYLTPESLDLPDARVVTVRSSAELWAAMLAFNPPPQTITLRRVPGSSVSRELNQELASTLRKLSVNRATFAEKGEVWVRHSLRNMRYLVERPTVATLSGAFRDKPCVIVSPGPSLAKNIAGLRALEGRVLIIASNRSVAPLRHAGITPDLVLVADPLDLRYQLEGDLLQGAGALLLDLVVHPGLYELEARRYFTFTTVHEVFNSTFGATGQGGLLPSGGSVATTALRLALELGCDPVLFVGQDLALAGDQYYIESAPDGATRIAVKNGVGIFENSSAQLKRAVQELGGISESRQATQAFLQVPGWEGRPVFTSSQFDNYRRWLEETVAGLEHPVRVINCTEGGAHIQHMEQLSLADAVASLDLSGIDVDGVLDAALARFEARKVKKELERQVTRMQLALNQSLAEVSRCETLCRQLQKNPAAFRNLEKSEKRLRAALAQAPFVTAWASAAVEAAQRTCANATSLEDNLKASRALYSVVEDAARAARPILSETLQYVRRSAEA
jgi:hypothetical protein